MELLTAVGLVKRFPLPEDRPATLKQRLLSRRRAAKPVTAVNGISLAVRRGECVGLIGANGSGKTTLLRLLAGIYQPTAGTIVARGRLAALLQLGAGFSAELSGRDNMLLNAALYGYDEEFVAKRLADIVAFAELADWLDRPLKCYSQGMHLRLAFAVAAHLPHDLLLIDEMLAVGDAVFRGRCHARLRELRAAGSAIVVASHDLAEVERHCTRVLVLKQGSVVFDGAPAAAIACYAGATCG